MASRTVSLNRFFEVEIEVDDSITGSLVFSDGTCILEQTRGSSVELDRRDVKTYTEDMVDDFRQMVTYITSTLIELEEALSEYSLSGPRVEEGVGVPDPALKLLYEGEISYRGHSTSIEGYVTIILDRDKQNIRGSRYQVNVGPDYKEGERSLRMTSVSDSVYSVIEGWKEEIDDEEGERSKEEDFQEALDDADV